MTADRKGSHGIAVKFWGVRGSIASPGPFTVRYGGNTCCIEVRCGDRVLILDAGTGIRLMGQTLCLEQPVDADVFLTHTHYDHIAGMPFFAPAYDRRNRFTLWEGHLGPDRTLQSVLGQMMSEPLFPVPVNMIEHACGYRKFVAGETLSPRPGIVVRTAALNHPNGCTGYRIEHAGRVVCLVTDTENTPGERDPVVLDLIAGADVLIYDAMFEDDELPAHRGWGHSTWQEGCRLAAAAGVKRLYLFHHDPSRTDDQLDLIGTQARALFAEAHVAVEGALVDV